MCYLCRVETPTSSKHFVVEPHACGSCTATVGIVNPSAVRRPSLGLRFSRRTQPCAARFEHYTDMTIHITFLFRSLLLLTSLGVEDVAEAIFRVGDKRLDHVPAVPHQLPRLTVEDGDRPEPLDETSR